MVFIQTPRLILRNSEDTDAEKIFEYRTGERCARYQRWTDTSLPDITCMVKKHRCDQFLSEQDEQRYVIAAADNSCIGDLSFFFNAADNCITLGITISPEHQRKGYAFEMLNAVILSIKNHYPEMDIVALIHPKNRSSILLFEKLGFIRECYAESIYSYVYTIFGMQK